MSWMMEVIVWIVGFMVGFSLAWLAIRGFVAYIYWPLHDKLRKDDADESNRCDGEVL